MSVFSSGGSAINLKEGIIVQTRFMGTPTEPVRILSMKQKDVSCHITTWNALNTDSNASTISVFLTPCGLFKQEDTPSAASMAAYALVFELVIAAKTGVPISMEFILTEGQELWFDAGAANRVNLWMNGKWEQHK